MTAPSWLRVAVVLAATVLRAQAVDLSGPWRVNFIDPGQDSCRFTVEQDAGGQLGGKLTGCALGTTGIFTGTVVGDTVDLAIVAPDDAGCEIYRMHGTVTPDGLSYTGTFACFTPLAFGGDFEAAPCDPDVPGSCPGPDPAEPLSVCLAHAPATGCAVSSAAKASLVLSRTGTFDWVATLKVPRATDTALAALGDPRTTTDYVACLYDTENGEPTLIAAEPIFGGSSCDGVPCWKATATGFVYRNRTRLGAKLQQVKVKAGATGKGSIVVKGGLSTVLAPAPGVPLGLPITARIVAGNTCWSATFDTATVTPSGQIKAKNGH